MRRFQGAAWDAANGDGTGSARRSGAATPVARRLEQQQQQQSSDEPRKDEKAAQNAALAEAARRHRLVCAAFALVSGAAAIAFLTLVAVLGSGQHAFMQLERETTHGPANLAASVITSQLTERISTAISLATSINVVRSWNTSNVHAWVDYEARMAVARTSTISALGFLYFDDASVFMATGASPQEFVASCSANVRSPNWQCLNVTAFSPNATDLPRWQPLNFTSLLSSALGVSTRTAGGIIIGREPLVLGARAPDSVLNQLSCRIDGSWVDSFTLSTPDGVPTKNVTGPLVGCSLRDGGVLVAVIGLQLAAAHLSHSLQQSGQHAVLVDRQGWVVASSNPADMDRCTELRPRAGLWPRSLPDTPRVCRAHIRQLPDFEHHVAGISDFHATSTTFVGAGNNVAAASIAERLNTDAAVVTGLYVYVAVEQPALDQYQRAFQGAVGAVIAFAAAVFIVAGGGLTIFFCGIKTNRRAAKQQQQRQNGNPYTEFSDTRHGLLVNGLTDHGAGTLELHAFPQANLSMLSDVPELQEFESKVDVHGDYPTDGVRGATTGGAAARLTADEVCAVAAIMPWAVVAVSPSTPSHLSVLSTAQPPSAVEDDGSFNATVPYVATATGEPLLQYGDVRPSHAAAILRRGAAILRDGRDVGPVLRFASIVHLWLPRAAARASAQDPNAAFPAPMEPELDVCQLAAISYSAAKHGGIAIVVAPWGAVVTFNAVAHVADHRRAALRFAATLNAVRGVRVGVASGLVTAVATFSGLHVYGTPVEQAAMLARVAHVKTASALAHPLTAAGAPDLCLARALVRYPPAASRGTDFAIFYEVIALEAEDPELGVDRSTLMSSTVHFNEHGEYVGGGAAVFPADFSSFVPATRELVVRPVVLELATFTTWAGLLHGINFAYSEIAQRESDSARRIIRHVASAASLLKAQQRLRPSDADFASIVAVSTALQRLAQLAESLGPRFADPPHDDFGVFFNTEATLHVSPPTPGRTAKNALQNAGRNSAPTYEGIAEQQQQQQQQHVQQQQETGPENNTEPSAA